MRTVTLLLGIHVASGVAGLGVGPVVMWLPKRGGRHPRLGIVYLVCLTCACLTAALLALSGAKNGALFLFVAVGTFAFAAAGYWAAWRRRGRWLTVHAVALPSSYAGMATAFVVNNFERATGITGVPFAIRALVPMFIGTCAVVMLGYQVHVGNRPKPAA